VRFLLVVLTLGCAQVLSYDDYRARTADATVDVSVDTAVTIVEDTRVDADADLPPLRVPARPSGDAVASGKGKTLWLAARRYSYGMADLAGVESEVAWMDYGYDLDEQCTMARESAENTGTCLRPAMAKPDSLLDGARCRDNNFGRHVGALLRASLPAGESTLNGLVGGGSTTWVLRIDDVDITANDAYAPGAFYRTGDDRMAMPAPTWEGSDVRTVQTSSLIDGDVNRPVITFPRGYISNGVWVSGVPAPLNIIAPITAVGFFPLELQHAVITLELNDTRTTGFHGLVAGAVPTSALKTMIDPIADFVGICPGTSLYDSMMTGSLRTADVSIGAPKLQDVTKTCDGVSTAIGFEVSPIAPLTMVVPATPPRKPKCADAG
jgi:hypothetical protein